MKCLYFILGLSSVSKAQKTRVPLKWSHIRKINSYFTLLWLKSLRASVFSCYVLVSIFKGDISSKWSFERWRKLLQSNFWLLWCIQGTARGCSFERECLQCYWNTYIAVDKLRTAVATWICYIVRGTSPFGMFLWKRGDNSTWWPEGTAV